MLRSTPPHPEAADSAREAPGRRIDRIGAGLTTPDAAFRAALAISAVLGVVIGHRLLDLPVLGEASRDDIARPLRPDLQALPGSAPEPEAGGRPAAR